MLQLCNNDSHPIQPEIMKAAHVARRLFCTNGGQTKLQRTTRTPITRQERDKVPKRMKVDPKYKPVTNLNSVFDEIDRKLGVDRVSYND